MTGRKHLRIVFVNDNCVYVSGFGSREMLEALKGRAPLWSSIGRAWTCQPRTARDLIAVAETRGYDVTIEHDDPLPAARGLLW